jgi:hypothetical protein
MIEPIFVAVVWNASNRDFEVLLDPQRIKVEPFACYQTFSTTVTGTVNTKRRRTPHKIRPQSNLMGNTRRVREGKQKRKNKRQKKKNKNKEETNHIKTS